MDLRDSVCGREEVSPIWSIFFGESSLAKQTESIGSAHVQSHARS